MFSPGNIRRLMSQKGRLRQTGGKGQRSATARWKKQEVKENKKEKKRKAEARRKAENICCITKILVYIETNIQNKEVKVF